MFSNLRCLIATASILLLAVGTNGVPTQFVLAPEISDAAPLITGRLWRFDVRNGSSSALEQVLSLAEVENLDLWHIATSHVDVYLPLSSPELPVSLRAISHSLVANITTPVPRRTTATSTEWNLSSLTNTAYHADYHPLYEVDSFIRELEALRPDLVKVNHLGHSGLGREMYGLTISKDIDYVEEPGSRVKEKRKSRQRRGKLSFVIVGAQHAREWVATATALYLSHALVANSTEAYSLTHLLDIYDFYIVPAPNPDGYDYTWETDRFWYKTRQKTSFKMKCFGVDMNRNWGYKWKRTPGRESASSNESIINPNKPIDPCSHWYPGHRPFEAPEVNNIANWVTTIPNVVAFVDLRSYGQMLSSPFSYSCKAMPKDAEDQMEAELGAVRAMQGVHGKAYQTGRLCQMLYTAPGNIVDWMYKRMGIKYSYVLHLRDTGTHGFVLPSEWIRPVGEETSAMVKYLAKFIAKKMGIE